MNVCCILEKSDYAFISTFCLNNYHIAFHNLNWLTVSNVEHISWFSAKHFRVKTK